MLFNRGTETAQACVRCQNQNDIQTKAAQSSKSGPNKPLQLWIPICGLWTNHYSLSICLFWLPQIDCKLPQMVTRGDAPAFIYCSSDGCLSLFNLHLILSKYHLYSASTWCKWWISHGEFSVGAPNGANAGVSTSRYYTLIPHRMNKKCVATQSDKDISLEATRLSYTSHDDVFSPYSA